MIKRKLERKFDLSTREKKIVQDSWKLVQYKSNITGQYIFYDHLFDISPESLRFFSTDTGISFDTLAPKFMNTMNFIVGNISNIDEAIPELEKLGRLHHKLEIDASFYDPFNESILFMVSEILEQGYTVEVEKAWSKLLSYISYIMIYAPRKESRAFIHINKIFKKIFG